ncbi:HdeD family acid-resistance protein [Leuconostoc pseudomesenteroides]|uniref:HdeD family acid-resistance protein n=1 Tax=Leuconostoc pseudomesenteroides TaxID=33968 RepID=UPI0039ECE31B
MSGEFFNTMRKAIGIDGLISSIIGALILFLPNLSAKVAAGMIGATLVVIGLFKLWTFFQLKSEGAMARFGNLLVAIIYMVAGIFIFVDMQSAAISLILVVGILTGMTWVIEGFVQLTILNQLANNKFWATLAAFVSILGGLSLLFSPVLGGLIVWTFFGVTLLVIGIVKLIQFATLKNS